MSDAPPGVDPATGEVIDPQALRDSLLPSSRSPANQSLGVLRKGGTAALSTGTEVYEHIRAEVRKLELAQARIAEVRKGLHGWTDDRGNYIAGAEFEYAEVFDVKVRDLYFACNDMDVPKEKRPKWPGVDVRESIVNEHIPKEMRQRLASLKGEMKTLEMYINVCRARMTGLVTLLAYHKEEMKMSGFPAAPQPGERGSTYGSR